MIQGYGFSGKFLFICRKQDRTIRWVDRSKNMIMDAWCTQSLNILFHEDTQITDFYIGLKGSNQAVVGTWLSSGIGVNFTEFTDYTSATRPIWNEGVAASKTISNSVNAAEFTVSGLSVEPTYLYGGFLSTNSVKGGTSGTLCCVSNLPSPRPLYNTDVLSVVYTIKAQDVA